MRTSFYPLPYLVHYSHTRAPTFRGLCPGSGQVATRAEFHQWNSRTGEGRWSTQCGVCGRWNAAPDDAPHYEGAKPNV